MIHTTQPTPENTQWVLTTDTGHYMSWGGTDDTMWCETTPTVGAVDVTRDRVQLTGREGTVPGLDTPRGFTVTLALVFYTTGDKAALAQLVADHGRIWQAGNRLHHSTTWQLACTYNATTMTTTGRCGSWTVDRTQQHTGVIRVAAEFEALIPWWLTTGPEPTTITATPTGTSTGLTCPVTLPWASRTEEDFTTTITVHDGPAWPTFTITGPISQPKIRVGSYELRINNALGDGETLTLVTLPTMRQITGPTEANWASSIDPSGAWLEELSLPTGDTPVQLAGVGVTTNTTMRVEWSTLQGG